jgi:hypothetical protein
MELLLDKTFKTPMDQYNIVQHEVGFNRGEHIFYDDLVLLLTAAALSGNWGFLRCLQFTCRAILWLLVPTGFSQQKQQMALTRGMPQKSHKKESLRSTRIKNGIKI